jgi:hypothetical protein
MQNFANGMLTDHTDGTPLDPFYWQLYLIFQGGDEETLDTVRVVMDNFRLTGAVTGPPALDGDFDLDDDVDGDDFLLWQRGGSPNPLSASDLTEWETNYGLGLPGDFSGNGIVDGTDFLIWQRGESPNPNSASDLALWEDSFGATSFADAAASGAVPEPSSAVLTLGLLALGVYSRPSRRRTIQHERESKFAVESAISRVATSQLFN